MEHKTPTLNFQTSPNLCHNKTFSLHIFLDYTNKDGIGSRCLCTSL